MHISIVTGNTTTQLADEPKFKFKDATVDVLGQRLTVTPVIGATVADGKFIKTINGIAPNERGEFFIDGSDCESWGVISGGTESMFGESDGIEPSDSGLSIVDLCPSCTTCEAVYRLKYEVENLKMWINTLKDVNLYMESAMDTRRTNLSSLRITGSSVSMEKCGVGLSVDDGYNLLQASQLLQQYMTVVHMWNYVVSQNNASTEIVIAPEDTTGFVVQTKRALPSCSDQQKIQCLIDVDCPTPVWDDTDTEHSMPAEYPISIYVPEGSLTLEFEPFDNYEQKALGGAGIHAVSTTRADQKHVYTDVINAKIAGTYVVTAKFLPFVGYEIWRDVVVGGVTTTTPISVRGGSAATYSEEPVEGGTVYGFGVAGYTSNSYLYPDEEDYLKAKTAPTCSVNFKLRYPVKITWLVTEKNGEIKKYEEDYLYTANGIRMYFGSAIITGSTVLDPIEIPEGTVSNA